MDNDGTITGLTEDLKTARDIVRAVFGTGPEALAVLPIVVEELLTNEYDDDRNDSLIDGGRIPQGWTR